MISTLIYVISFSSFAIAQMITPHGSLRKCSSDTLTLECEVSSFTSAATWSNDGGTTQLTQCFAGGICTTTSTGNYAFTSNATGTYVTILQPDIQENGVTWICTHLTTSDTYSVVVEDDCGLQSAATKVQNNESVKFSVGGLESEKDIQSIPSNLTILNTEKFPSFTPSKNTEISITSVESPVSNIMDLESKLEKTESTVTFTFTSNLENPTSDSELYKDGSTPFPMINIQTKSIETEHISFYVTISASFVTSKYFFPSEEYPTRINSVHLFGSILSGMPSDKIVTFSSNQFTLSRSEQSIESKDSFLMLSLDTEASSHSSTELQMIKSVSIQTYIHYTSLNDSLAFVHPANSYASGVWFSQSSSSSDVDILPRHVHKNPAVSSIRSESMTNIIFVIVVSSLFLIFIVVIVVGFFININRKSYKNGLERPLELSQRVGRTWKISSDSLQAVDVPFFAGVSTRWNSNSSMLYKKNWKDLDQVI